MGAQLLGQRTGVGCEDTGETFARSHLQHFVFHELHDGDVLLGVQLGAGAHHAGVEDLVVSGRELIVSEKSRNYSIIVFLV